MHGKGKEPREDINDAVRKVNPTKERPMSLISADKFFYEGMARIKGELLIFNKKLIPGNSPEQFQRCLKTAEEAFEKKFGEKLEG